MAIFGRPNDHFFNEFWIGENIDMEKYWSAYHKGDGYKAKFLQMECRAFEITFEIPEKELPLFNLEPIFKTFKSLYYQFKEESLPKDEFKSAGPLFIYEINRGSGIWTFLGENPYIIPFAIILVSWLIWGTTPKSEKMEGNILDNLEKKLKILKDIFGEENLKPELVQKFLRASSRPKIRKAFVELYNEHVKTVKVSRIIISNSIEDAKKEMVDIGEILRTIENK